MVTGLSSFVPTDAQSTSTATATNLSRDLNTKDGGFLVAGATNNVAAAQACTWTGDQTPTETYDTVAAGYGESGAFTSAVVNDTANTVTATFDVISTTGIALAAAAWR